MSPIGDGEQLVMPQEAGLYRTYYGALGRAPDRGGFDWWLDQIVNNAAKLHYMFDGQFTAPLVIRTACGGGFGGGPHHSQSVEGWFLNVPGIVIVAPPSVSTTAPA